MKSVDKAEEILASIEGKEIYMCPKTGRRRVRTRHSGISKTDQSFAPQCDMNNVIAKFKRDGVLTHIKAKPGVFADVSKVQDLLGNMVLIDNARKSFMDLPAKVRSIFHNKMENMVEFMNDPNNLEQAIELGLVPRPAETGSVDKPTGSKPQGGAAKEEKDGSVSGDTKTV